jgi:hypothetical protein
MGVPMTRRRSFWRGFWFTILALLVIALLGCTTGHAGVVKPPAKPAVVKLVVKDPLVPPPWYDKPFIGILMVFRVRYEDMEAVCKNAKRAGCARPRTIGGTGCEIYIGEDDHLKKIIGNITYRVVYRHELGHCNGWPADHSMVKPLSPEELRAIAWQRHAPVPWTGAWVPWTSAYAPPKRRAIPSTRAEGTGKT